MVSEAVREFNYCDVIYILERENFMCPTLSSIYLRTRHQYLVHLFEFFLQILIFFCLSWYKIITVAASYVVPNYTNTNQQFLKMASINLSICQIWDQEAYLSKNRVMLVIQERYYFPNGTKKLQLRFTWKIKQVQLLISLLKLRVASYYHGLPDQPPILLNF